MGSSDPLHEVAAETGEARGGPWSSVGREGRARPLPSPRVPTKLEQPAADPGLVPRTRLVDQLVHSTAAPLVVVSAPPGYGKTALLTQWAAVDPRPFSWIRLDAADKDPAVLLMYLASALNLGGA